MRIYGKGISITILLFLLGNFILGIKGVVDYNYNVNDLNPMNAPDVPGFTGNLRVIAAGSIIIPMDPSLQVLDPGTGLLSVLPYGLVIRTLWQNVSVSWAIQSGKVFNGADVTANTSRATFAGVANAGLSASTTSWDGIKTL